MFGGLAAVIYTELLQAVVLLLGAATLTIIGLGEVGGMAGLRAALPPDYFHMIKPSSDAAFPWTGIFFGAPILGIWYWCTDQMIVQRVLGAKNEAHARGGALLCGLLKILPVFVLVLPGLIARALYPDIAGDAAYPTLVLRLLPTGLVGFMVAALMAALMSSLAATFNSASTLVTFDVYKKVRPDASEKQLVGVGRIVTVVMVGLSMLWVPFIKYLSSEVYIYLQSVQAYISPPIAAVFLVGVFWPRANRFGAIASLVVGAVLGAARFLSELNRGSALVSGSTAPERPDHHQLPSLRRPVVRRQRGDSDCGLARHRARVDGQAARPDVCHARPAVPAGRRRRPLGVHDAAGGDHCAGALHDWVVGPLRVGR